MTRPLPSLINIWLAYNVADQDSHNNKQIDTNADRYTLLISMRAHSTLPLSTAILDAGQLVEQHLCVTSQVRMHQAQASQAAPSAGSCIVYNLGHMLQ